MPEMTDAELRALARQHSQTDPRPGTDWRELLTGRIVNIVNKPLDAETLGSLVCYHEPGNPIYCSTLARFTEDVDLPDGSRAPRFAPTDFEV